MNQSSTSQNASLCDEGLELSSSCLFCGNQDFDEAATCAKDFFFKCDSGTFDYLRCRDCGSLWLRNRPFGARLLQAYGSYYTHAVRAPDFTAGTGLAGRAKAAYVRSRYARSASLVDRLAGKAIAVAGWNTSGIDEQLRFAPKAPAKVLDYGCGSGEYLLRLYPLGYELHGAEYDPQLIGNLADRGICIADVTGLADSDWQNEFDHITLAHVLEHVPDPQALLRRLFGWLKPGGTLYLEVPNADATGLAIFGRYWRGLEAPRHFALPSRTALTTALADAGFGAVRQHINATARGWVWAESLEASPAEQQAAFSAAMAATPAETCDNAEFLTVIATKPAA
jgi:SAM-dependent methyltransferase